MKKFLLSICFLFILMFCFSNFAIAMLYSELNSNRTVCLKPKLDPSFHLAAVDLKACGARVSFSKDLFNWLLVHEGNGIYTLQIADFCMQDLVLESSLNDPSLCVHPYCWLGNQLWSFEEVGKSNYRILQQTIKFDPLMGCVPSNKCLTYNLSNGQVYISPLFEFGNFNYDSQLWVIEDIIV